MRIQTNIPSLNAQGHVQKTQREMQTSMTQMASGNRINKAGDDAAGLATSKNMEMHLRSVGQATRNANDAVSLIQIAEGSFNEMNTILVRLRELSMMAASDTIGAEPKQMIDKEAQQLHAEMDRISKATKWGSNRLLTGEGGSFDFQVGIFGKAEDNRITVNVNDIDTRTETLGMGSIDLSTSEAARVGLAQIDQAQTALGLRRSNIGAIQNRLTATIDNLGVQNENLSAAKSRLADTDIAKASASLLQTQVINNAGVSVLAQANQVANVALKLL